VTRVDEPHATEAHARAQAFVGMDGVVLAADSIDRLLA